MNSTFFIIVKVSYLSWINTFNLCSYFTAREETNLARAEILYFAWMPLFTFVTFLSFHLSTLSFYINIKINLVLILTKFEMAYYKHMVNLNQ